MSVTLSTPTRPLTVLIVDDNAAGADALAVCLQSNGYEVRLAYDGSHAVEAIQAESCDAVLCDIGLPDRDGYEVAREVRRVLGYRPLLVAITAFDTQVVRETARAAGFDYFVTKPVDPNELDRLLQAHSEWLIQTADAAGVW